MAARREVKGSAVERLRDLVTVQRHTSDFGRTWTDQHWRREVLGRAQRARDRRADRPKIDVLPRDGDDFLVARGELLLASAAYEPARAQRLVAEQGLTAEPIKELKSRVYRLARPVATLEELEAAEASLRHKGIPVAFNFVPPMAVVIKSQGGAEPAARRWEELPETTTGTGTERGSGAGVRVAVIDTGVADQERSDGWLSGVARRPSADDPGNIDVLYSNPDAPEEERLLDAAGGHGTAVTGIIQHEAPEVPLVVYNTIPPDGSALESDIACAMVRAVEDGLAAGDKVVLNLSLGTTTVDDTPPLALQTAVDLIEEMAAAEPEHDVLLVAAAGNYGTSKIVWPAGFNGVVAVGALGQDGKASSWSSYGPWVDCSVIGDGVLSVYVEGREDPFFDTAADTFEADSWALHFGTSFAAPQVAGQVAAVAGAEGIGLRDALGKVLATSKRREPGLGRVLEIQEPIGG
jgi:subtilisin family serine protease